MANTETRRINLNAGEILPLTFDLTKWGAAAPGSATVVECIDLSSRNDVASTVAVSPDIVNTTDFQVTIQNTVKKRDYALYLQWAEGSITHILKVNLRSQGDD